MALAVRQILVSAGSSATSLTRTFASAVLAGSLLVAHGAVFNGTGSGEPTISDTVNSTWTTSATTGYAVSGDADSELWLWSFPNSAAGTPAVTINPPGGNSDNDLTLFEVTGAATTTPRDITVTSSSTFTQNLGYTSSVTTGTLAQAAEFVIFSHSHTAEDAALATDTGDGFTQADENESNSGGQCFNVGYKITAATTSLVCNGTRATSANSGTKTWFTGVASFKEAAAAAGVLGKRYGTNQSVNRASTY